MLPKKAVYFQQSSYSMTFFQFSKNIRNIFLKQVPVQKLSSPHCDEMEGREIRRSRRGASALKSGRRPRGRGPWHCRRPSVVTEGYIRLPPPAADHLRSIRVHPRSTIIVVIYSVFCVWCSKNIVFYRVSGPSAAQNCTFGDVKKCGFFHSFCFEGRKKSQKIVSADVLDGLGANIGPTSAKMWATWVNIRLR